MYYIGIDPGKTGAMAVLNDQGKLVDVKDFQECFMPLKEAITAMGVESYIAYLEEVHSMPKQGVASTFAFGENFGWWKGILQAFGISFKTVRPQDWQKGLVPKKNNLTDKPGLAVARQLYPDAPLNLKKHHNRADAILLARVCWQREGRNGKS